jgi:hypothetical protein
VKAVAGACIVALAAFPVLAQDSLAGAYRGNFTVDNFNVGVTLVIAQVQDGKLTGTGTFHGGSCAGDYPVQGGVKGDGIGLISTKKGGASADCVFGFRGRIEGNQLVGSMGRHQVTLRK